MDTPAHEDISRATGTEYVSAQSRPQGYAEEPPHGSTARASSDQGDAGSIPHRLGASTPSSPTPQSLSSGRPAMQVTLHRDESGESFLVDQAGNHVMVTLRNDNRSASTSSQDDAPRVPLHPSDLFGLVDTRRQAARSPPRAYDQISPPPQPYGADTPLPQLELDIDPDTLTAEQLGQLNAVRAHLGTANARLTASTAVIAEQQAATEDVQDTIQATRAEMVSRLDSLRDEVNSQRARLNRCLDDNLRTLTDNGASTTQVNDILEIMNRNNGAHRLPSEAPAIVTSVSASHPLLPIPDTVRSSIDAMVSPRGPHESSEEFEKRATAVLRMKEHAHNAFPLPVPERANPGYDPITQRHTVLNSRHPASAMRSEREIERLEQRTTGSRARFRNEPDDREIPNPLPMGMGTSISGYHTSVGPTGRDAMIDFADDMSELIRTTISHRVGERIELPPGVRPAKVDNRAKYSGQDDHEVFMASLEKLLGWMRSSGYGGADLETYRISLLSAYLEGDAHQWYTTEVDNPRTPGLFQSDFAGIVCALHRRFVKSSSAQRATRAFEAVRYDPSTGPEKLASELITKGQAMVEMPSDFTIKDKFLKALPNWISKELKMRRGVTAEFSQMEFMRFNSRQIWEVESAIRDEETARTHTTSTSANKPVASGSRPTFRTDNSRSARPTGLSADRAHSSPATGANATPIVRDRPVIRKDTKGCFTCGGTDHFAKDKVCPRYNERDTTRERPRVAAQRVTESYSDAGSDMDSDRENEEALLSAEEGDYDEHEAPDLDDLIYAANASDRQHERFGAMRNPLRYYSMRIPEDELDDSVPEVIPASSPEDNASGEETGLLSPMFVGVVRHPTLGNYNPGPVCVVCHDCSLVIRRVAATAENGLPEDGEYTVCVHLADVGLDPAYVALPTSPTLPTVALPPAEATPRDTDVRLYEMPENRTYGGGQRVYQHTTFEPVFRGYPILPVVTEADEVNSEGDLLNSIGDPDLPLGILMDVTSGDPYDQYRSAEEEVASYEALRATRGLRAFTAHEYDVNIRHLRRYRAYVDEEEMDRARAEDWSDEQDANMRADPTYGPQFRAREAISAAATARREEDVVNQYGADTYFEADPSQRRILRELGPDSRLHELGLQRRYRTAAAVQIRRLIDANQVRFEEIRLEIAQGHDPVADDLWIRARNMNRNAGSRLSYHLAELQHMVESIDEERVVERARLNEISMSGLHDTQTIESERIPERDPALVPLPSDTPVPDDEAEFWDALPVRFSTEELLTTPLPDTATDGEDQPPSVSFASARLEQSGCESPETTTVNDASILVRESYDSSSPLESPLEASATDEVIVQSVIMTGPREAERANILVDRNNNVYMRLSELPEYHHLNPTFRPIHEAAMQTALAAREQPMQLYSYSQGPRQSGARRREELEEDATRLPTLPWDCESILLPETEVEAVSISPISLHPLRRRVEIEELDEEPSLLPTLPWNHERVYELDSDYTDPLPGLLEDDSDDEFDGLFYDAHDHLDGIEYCTECFADEVIFEPVWHMETQTFVNILWLLSTLRNAKFLAMARPTHGASTRKLWRLPSPTCTCARNRMKI
ncbi:hypothetical protein DFH06DRAFT_1127034 [Mycena polygramma]|nr:hypothetical protein DFH06DRAFT_1127034 [Mycena polygramma]